MQAEATKLAGGLFDLVYDSLSTPDTQPLGYALTAPDAGALVVVSPPAKLGGVDGPKKKVLMARGLFALPGNAEIGASLLGALPALLEKGAIKVRELCNRPACVADTTDAHSSIDSRRPFDLAQPHGTPSWRSRWHRWRPGAAEEPQGQRDEAVRGAAGDSLMTRGLRSL